MLRIRFALLLASIIICQVYADEAEYTIIELPTFEINLDLEPEERFKEVTAHFKDEATALIDYFLNLLPEGQEEAVEKIFEELEPFLQQTRPTYFSELKGISDILEIPLNQVLAVQYIYELSSFCTSILAREADGTVIHGRNLDFNPSDLGRATNFIARFMKNGEHLYSGVQFAGSAGLFTGMKEGAFSISQNTRTSEFTVEKLIENFELIFKGYYQVSWLVRDTLENCDDFACSLSNLATRPLITLSYLIVAGVDDYEGAVISRDRFGSAHIEMLSEDRWYVVQSNDDHFAGVCQGRCQAALSNMEALGADSVNRSTMKSEVMFVGPTLNSDTIFNAMMIPSEGYMDVTGVASDYPYED